MSLLYIHTPTVSSEIISNIKKTFSKQQWQITFNPNYFFHPISTLGSNNRQFITSDYKLARERKPKLAQNKKHSMSDGTVIKSRICGIKFSALLSGRDTGERPRSAHHPGGQHWDLTCDSVWGRKTGFFFFLKERVGDKVSSLRRPSRSGAEYMKG